MARIPPLPELHPVAEVDSYPVMMQKMDLRVDDSTIGQKLSASVAGAREEHPGGS